MTRIHHLNCVEIQSPFHGRAIDHCLLLEEAGRLVLIDAGIGLTDTRDPVSRLGQNLIDLVGFQFDERHTAVRQIEQLGFDPAAVTDCVVSHLDPDHIAGLADFPQATVHVSAEEYENFLAGRPRYLRHQLEHQPPRKTYSATSSRWFGFEARKVNISVDLEVYLIPLFGHTYGHCGIVIGPPPSWIFYVADAYYLKEELSDPSHPVHKLAEVRADDNNLRIESLDRIRDFSQTHPEVMMFSYHDPQEFETVTLDHQENDNKWRQ